MEYNSRREELIISEYGRHVQGLIFHAKTIEDKEYRQHFVEKVVSLMDQMNPQTKNVREHQEKLWRHVFRIANYELDVVPTVGDVPTPEMAFTHPPKLTYPQSEFRFRHYGHYIQTMITKALEMEDEVQKISYAYIIASYMKLAYRTWNREHYVNDEIIKQDLKVMSGGEIILPAETPIENLVPPGALNTYKKKSSGKSKNYKGNNQNRKRAYSKKRN
jgi:hypothetical protein